MPELPEVETVRRGVRPHIVGQRIDNVIIRERRLRVPVNSDFKKRVSGQCISDLRRRGKYLMFDLERGGLLTHLGMSGVLFFSDSPPNRTMHEHVGLQFKERFLLFKDPRRFGCMIWCAHPPDSHPLLANLGPEPLSAKFNGKVLQSKLQNKSVAIKSALMDGKTVAGVGNIYAVEALHLAGIRPQTPARRLCAERTRALSSAIKTVLRRAIRAGGSTLRDFAHPDREPGWFQTQWKVYGRKDQQCSCGARIKQIIQNNRSTYYCPNCQT